MKRLKLAYICPWFSTEYKGPLYNLLSELSKYIDIVCICSRQKYVQYFKRSEKYVKTIEQINPHFIIHRFNSFAPRDIVIPLNLNEILEREKPDVIQSDEYFRFTSICSYKFSKRNKIPFILNSRMRERKGLFRNAFLWLMKILAKDMVRNSKIIAIGKTAKNEFSRWFPWKKEIDVVPTGIDPNKFRNIGKREAITFRKKYGIPLNKKIILNVGRIYPVKRIDLLIKAFDSVKKKYENVVLVIVGPSEEREMKKIKNLISELDLKVGEDIFFTGPISNEQIGPAYTAADVFANTSETEGICFSFLEAMCFGLPIVAFDVGGNKDVIQNGKNGFLVKFLDIENFSKCLIKILTNSKLVKNINKNSYKILKNNFDLNTISKKLIKIYKNLSY